MSDLPVQPYRTVFKAVACEIDKIKGSRFIAFLEPTESKDVAESRLKELKKSYPDATHHCFAYITGAGGQLFQRYSDDGEPAGAAGRPILQVLEGKELKNILLVVVRYYGGTKLGTGGLVKAYTESALEAVQNAEIILIEAQSKITLEYEYSLHNLILQLVEANAVRIIQQDFTDKVTVELEIRSALKERFLTEVVDKSNGQVILIDN